jgi:hypothetical protein
MEGVWPIIFLAVVLKIPVFFAIWLVWWAVKAEPELEDAAGEGGDHSFRRWRRQPTKPRGPRRGPHGGAAHAQPEHTVRDRIRTGLRTRTRGRELAER